MTEKPDPLRVILEIAINTSNSIIIDLPPDDDLMPVFISIDTDSKITVMGTPWKNDEEKVMMIEAIREQYKKQNIVAYVHVSEAWSATYTPKEVKNHKDLEIMPRDRPDRKEIMVVIGQDIYDNRVGVEFDILRDDKGMKTLGEKRERRDKGDGGEIGGRLATLLETRTMQ